MQRSTDRILVTHVGSLVRPMAIRDILAARDHGQPYDEAAYEKTLREEVAGIVRKQADVGVDIVSDGEYGKAGWIRYVAERLGLDLERFLVVLPLAGDRRDEQATQERGNDRNQQRVGEPGAKLALPGTPLR